MAIYHCSIKIGSRTKGQSAIAAAAYRSGEKLIDQETGLTSDYTRKSGVVFTEISLCTNAPAEYADRAALWNAVHQIEKNKNAQLWREFEVALPQELNRNDQIETIRKFVAGLNLQGMCADWSLHDKGDGNPHAHIMTTMRSITESGEWAPKSRKVYDLDENGERIFQKIDKSGRKQYKCHKEDYNDWNATERVEEWRTAWAKCCNARLAEHDRIDHRSYERQGIDQEPTIHEGYAARKIAAGGGYSERIEENREIRERNTIMKRLAEELKDIEQQLTELIQEKGREINEGKQRIAELLKRRNRTIADNERELAEGERNPEEAILRAADKLIQDTEINQEAVRAAAADTEATIQQSNATIRESEAATASAAAHRQERELAEQRRAAEESRSNEEARRISQESSRRERSQSMSQRR